MIKIKLYILFILGSGLINISVAQQAISRNKIDSLLKLTKSASEESKVVIYKQISSFYQGKNNDTVFYYANLSLESANIDKSDNSFYEAFKSLGNAYADKFDYAHALEYFLKSKEYCKKANNKSNIIDIQILVGKAYRNIKRFSDAIDSYKEAYEVAKEIGDFNNEGTLLFKIANVYYDINDLNKALEYAIKSANIFIANNIELDKAKAYNFIGYVHMVLKNNDLAEEYYEKAYNLYLKGNDLVGLSVALNNLGVMYSTNKNNQKAIEFYSKSLVYAKQQNDDDAISTAMNNIGMIYVEMGEIEKGLKYYFESQEYSVKLFDKTGYINTFNNIAAAYLQAGNLQKANEYVNKALPFAGKLTDLAYIQECYQILSQIYSMKGMFNKAFEYKSLQLAYNDSLYTRQQTSSILEMQTRFETVAKEKEIQLLKKDREIGVLEVERHKSFQKYLVIFSILLLISVIIFSLRIKRKNNLLLSVKNRELEQINKKLIESEQNLIELNATKDKFFSIIAHDLKNPFNALLGFSQLLERNYDTYTKTEIKEYINVIYESSQSLFKLLDNLLQWSRTQTGSITYNPEIFNLLPVIKQEITYLQFYADKKKIAIKVTVDSTISAFADKNIISTVIRNLINNAIKFTNSNGKVEIRAVETINEIEVSIADTGVGIDVDDLEKLFQLNSSISNKGTANEEGTGLGLLLCKEFIERNGGRIWANSNKGKGSTFYFTLPKETAIN
ncbi:MAG: tetratricopeptide repeat-containing sensor histidine kinase [Bacteroidales bacterium]|nr:tetratricopeptide repeat-containing sensor histidine kinase [Bacteroidales bacterium]